MTGLPLIVDSKEEKGGIRQCRKANRVDIAMLIELISPFNPNPDKVDALRWNHTNDGLFSMKSYKESKWLEDTPKVQWKKIWKWDIPSKVVFFT